MLIVVSSSTCRREYAEPFLTQTPLVLLLVAEIATTLWSMGLIFRFYYLVALEPSSLLKVAGMSLSCKHSIRS